MAIKLALHESPSAKKTKTKSNKLHTVRLIVDFPAEITSDDRLILSKMTNRLLKYVFEESTPEELEKRNIKVYFNASKDNRPKKDTNYLVVSTNGNWIPMSSINKS
jgi:hypothetical protein